MTAHAEFFAIAAMLGLIAGAIYATDDEYTECDGIQIIHTEPDGCQSVRTDSGWAPRLRRDGSRFCGVAK
jgi:hypothetical protein